MKPEAITHEEVRYNFDYREDGALIWRVLRNSRAPIGSVAGTIDGKGYVQIKFDGRLYRGHRLVWLWHKGALPVFHIDHINRIRTDNRIENLRDVITTVNRFNTAARGTYQPHGKKGWVAQTKDNGRAIYIGTYPTEEEAHQAYLDEKQRLLLAIESA